jgi:hypothetical protein
MSDPVSDRDIRAIQLFITGPTDADIIDFIKSYKTEEFSKDQLERLAGLALEYNKTAASGFLNGLANPNTPPKTNGGGRRRRRTQTRKSRRTFW